MKQTKIIYTGETPVSIQAGEFKEHFEPNETYEVHPRFALHLTEAEENFEIVPEEEIPEVTIQSLLKNKHEVLVEMAKELHEKPASLNKQQLAELILGGQQNG